MANWKDGELGACVMVGEKLGAVGAAAAVDGLLSERQIGLLGEAPVGRLATADADARPYVIPVCFVYDAGAGVIYSALDGKPKRSSLAGLRRVRNIRANPQAALVVDHYAEYWSELWYLLVMGRAEVVDSGAEPARAVALLRAKYRQYREMAIDGNPVIRLTPERVAGWSGR